jgi:GTP-binding protein Era
MKPHRAGFIAILGRPNAGKSTLFNAILGEKMAIVSEKPQTTRNRILGIRNVDGGQLIFLDTPGIHQGGSALNERMISAALASGKEGDLLVFLMDASSPRPEEDHRMVAALEACGHPSFLVLNKIDLIKKERLLPLMDQYRKFHPFEALLPVSARTGEGISDLLEGILKFLPESPPLYPDDMITDQSERFLVSEIIREKVILHSYQEIPFVTAVTIETFQERPQEDLILIKGTIHVERDSQKKIVIGKGGQKLRAIGEMARKEIEALLGRRVYLDLWVHMERNWTRDPRALDEFGYALQKR